MEKKKSRNAEVLKDFTKYCKEHPQERFWQSLRNWAEVAFVYVSNGDLDNIPEDTFYWEGKNK